MAAAAVGYSVTPSHADHTMAWPVIYVFMHQTTSSRMRLAISLGWLIPAGKFYTPLAPGYEAMVTLVPLIRTIKSAGGILALSTRQLARNYLLLGTGP